MFDEYRNENHQRKKTRELEIEIRLDSVEGELIAMSGDGGRQNRRRDIEDH